MKPSTEQLKEALKEQVNKYNEAVQTQSQCKDQIIALQAIIQDRENGDTANSSSDYSED